MHSCWKGSYQHSAALSGDLGALLLQGVNSSSGLQRVWNWAFWTIHTAVPWSPCLGIHSYALFPQSLIHYSWWSVSLWRSKCSQSAEGVCHCSTRSYYFSKLIYIVSLFTFLYCAVILSTVEPNTVPFSKHSAWHQNFSESHEISHHIFSIKH